MSGSNKVLILGGISLLAIVTTAYIYLNFSESPNGDKLNQSNKFVDEGEEEEEEDEENENEIENKAVVKDEN